MSLLERGAQFLKGVVENTKHFGRPCTVTNPDGDSLAMVGLYRDISLMIDPSTGQQVAGNTASITLSLRSLKAATVELPDGLGVPVGINDGTQLPWVVQLVDLQGKARTFKVSTAMPDEVGCVVCELEAHRL